MLFADTLTLDAPKRTTEGFLAVRAKASRTGVYQYTGAEVDPENKHGLRDKATVNVLRDADTVFDKKAVHSFIGKPITDNHPNQAVNAENWRDHARGVVMGAVKDGEYVSFDLLLTDATAISAIDGGKRELSNGYAAELEFGDFEAADGTKCPVRQLSIRGNHVAIVDRGRAGSECRIADAARCNSLPADAFELLLDERTYSNDFPGDKNNPAHVGTKDGVLKMAHTLMIDGLQVPNVSDEAKAAIEKLQGQATSLADAKGKADAALVDANKALETEKGKVTALEAQVKDAAITPDKLQKLVADRSVLVAQAHAVDPTIVTDGKTDAEIRKAVVTAKLGDAAAALSDDAISGAFAIAVKDAKVETKDALRDAISNQPANIGDAKSTRDAIRASQYA